MPSSSNHEGSMISGLHMSSTEKPHGILGKSSLFSRMSPGNTMKSPGANMTARTAASTQAGGSGQATGNQTTKNSTMRNAGASPFKEAMSKGIVSGTGLLTH